MAKSTNRSRSRKFAMACLASWFRGWKPFIKRTLRNSALQFPSCLAISSLVVLILSAVLYVSLRSPELRQKMWGWIEELAVNIFIVVVFLFALYLIVVFLFSLHPKTRRIASKLSIFLNEPEVEKLREKVEGIDKDLQKIKSTLGDIEKHLKDNRKLK